MSQLDFHYKDLLKSIRVVSKQKRDSNVAFFVLTFGTLLLAGCETDLVRKKNAPIEIKTERANTRDSAHAQSEQIISTADEKPSSLWFNEDSLDIVVYGNLVCTSPESNHGLRFRTDTMPEFKGGMDGLHQYLKTNLIYPYGEKENNIEGIVYVRFIIDSNGKTRQPEIMKSVPESPNFEAEAIRLINKMPTGTLPFIMESHLTLNLIFPFGLNLRNSVRNER
tara:strand:- start:4064 stop:4732 length:669 start_codon:yes stop_codon:yes gene_type:complete